MCDENRQNFYGPTFIKFATSLQKPIDLSQFSKIDSETISWTNQPRYNGEHLYMTITLCVDDTSFTSYRFLLSLKNADSYFYKSFIGKTPQECVSKLNAEIDECIAQEKAKSDIWGQYGF